MHALAVDPELVEHRLVGLEAVQVVVLLEPRVAKELALGEAPARRMRSTGIASGTSTRRAARQLTWRWAPAYS